MALGGASIEISQYDNMEAFTTDANTVIAALAAGGGGGGTTDYNALFNKPKIGGVE